jgi:hypothetical protein
LVGKTDVPAITDDEMIQNLNTQEFTGCNETCGEAAIFAARLGVATRVIMQEDDGRCGLPNR